MKSLRRLSCAFAACAATFVLAARSSGATPPAASQASSNEVEGVEIVAPHDSKVVATYPAQGAAIAPGLLVLKVGFDIVMSPQRWGYAKAVDGAYPQCLEKPRLLADERTFVLLCSVAPSTAYAIDLDAPGGPGFQGAGGRRSPPYTLRFTTTDAPPNATLAAAMVAATLPDGDSPLMQTGVAPPAKP